MGQLGLVIAIWLICANMLPPMVFHWIRLLLCMRNIARPVGACRRISFDCRPDNHIIGRTNNSPTSMGGDPMETSQLTAAVGRAPARSGFGVRPLSPALGAEITGVDLREKGDDALTERLL